MIFFKKPTKLIEEEGIKLPFYGDLISKDLKVFYNKEMKLNRDFSMLLINSYFDKPITYCDPMAASGIREMRFLKTIPNKFKEINMGDISKSAIKDIKNNFKFNKINLNKVNLIHANATNTMAIKYYNMIELDPFGSPVPFLDLALQRIKHKGILSVTATDTAALSGTHPKKSLRRYGVKSKLTLWHEEFGLRSLIAYCIKEAGKYDKKLNVLVSYSNKHYYRIFFEAIDSRDESLKDIKNLKYVEIDSKTQDIKLNEFETKNSIGKIYTKEIVNKEIVSSMISNINLLNDKKETLDLLEKLNNEIDVVGYYNPHKLQKSFKFGSQMKFNTIVEKLENNEFEVSRPHNNRLGIKTTAKGEDIIKIMKED